MVRFPDDVAVHAVGEIENLSAELSRKIWQKIMILDRRSETATGSPPPPPG